MISHREEPLFLEDDLITLPSESVTAEVDSKSSCDPQSTVSLTHLSTPEMTPATAGESLSLKSAPSASGDSSSSSMSTSAETMSASTQDLVKIACCSPPTTSASQPN